MRANICRVEIPPDEPNDEPDIEDDDAELILEKVEEEMMAECEDEDEDILHVDDITKLYGQDFVSKRSLLEFIKQRLC